MKQYVLACIEGKKGCFTDICRGQRSKIYAVEYMSATFIIGSWQSNFQAPGFQVTFTMSNSCLLQVIRESWAAIVSFLTLEGARLTFENRFSQVNFYMLKVTIAFERCFCYYSQHWTASNSVPSVDLHPRHFISDLVCYFLQQMRCFEGHFLSINFLRPTMISTRRKPELHDNV